MVHTHICTGKWQGEAVVLRACLPPQHTTRLLHLTPALHQACLPASLPASFSTCLCVSACLCQPVCLLTSLLLLTCIEVFRLPASLTPTSLASIYCTVWLVLFSPLLPFNLFYLVSVFHGMSACLPLLLSSPLPDLLPCLHYHHLH